MARLPIGCRKRKDGLYEIRFTDNGQRKSAYGHTTEECRENLERLKNEIKNGLSTKNKNITLEKYYEEWRHNRRGTVKPSTEYTLDERFARLPDFIKNRKVREIERRDIKKVQNILKEKHCTNTVNETMDLLKSILLSAIDDDIILKNPCRGLKPLKRTEPEARDTIHRALTAEERTAFFKFAAGSWYYELFCFLLNTGCRIGEALALTWGDIDYKNNCIHINKTLTKSRETVIRKGITKEINTFATGSSAKTAKGNRDVPLTDTLKDILKAQKEKDNIYHSSKVLNMAKDKERLVFEAAYEMGGQVSPPAIRATMTGIINKANKAGYKLEHFSPHAFRDSFATEAIKQGMNPNTLKEILGHSSLDMTMNIYAHVFDETKQAEMQKITINT